MSVDWGALIRKNSYDCLTPNIVSLDDANTASIEYQPFRKLKSDVEYIPFFEFEGRYFYSLAFEFRGINNNLLFLITELKYNNFWDLAELLESSMQKEEGFHCKIKPAVIRLKQQPVHCVELPDFTFDKKA